MTPGVVLKALRDDGFYTMPRGDDVLAEDLLMTARSRDIFNKGSEFRRTHENGVSMALRGIPLKDIAPYWGVGKERVYDIFRQMIEESRWGLIYRGEMQPTNYPQPARPGVVSLRLIYR